MKRYTISCEITREFIAKDLDDLHTKMENWCTTGSDIIPYVENYYKVVEENDIDPNDLDLEDTLDYMACLSKEEGAQFVKQLDWSRIVLRDENGNIDKDATITYINHKIDEIKDSVKKMKSLIGENK